MQEFLELVKKMRQAQINHQRFNSTITAFKCLSLELRVDQIVEVMLRVIEIEEEKTEAKKAKKEFGYQQ